MKVLNTVMSGLTIIEFSKGEHIVYSYGKAIAVSFNYGECWIGEKPSEDEEELESIVRHIHYWLEEHHGLCCDKDGSYVEANPDNVRMVYQEYIDAVTDCVSVDYEALLESSDSINNSIEELNPKYTF